MRCKFIILFLFFGITVFYATAKFIHQNETLFETQTIPQKNQSAVATFVLVNPKQIQRAEITVKRFLSRLTPTGPITWPITLKLSSPGKGYLPRMIRKICEIIRMKIMEFARASGLTVSVHRYERIPWNFMISEDWFSEGLIQGSLLLLDLARIGEEAWFTINHYFDTHNMTLQENNELLSPKVIKNFKFLSTVDDAIKFNEKLFKCLLSIRDRKRKRSSFDLNRILANLIKYSPNNIVKVIKSSLDRASSHVAISNDTSSKQLCVLLCHSLIERASYYDDCIEELRRLESCVLSTRRDLRKSIVSHILSVEPWLTAIEDLSGCKIYIDADGSGSVHCNFDRRIPRTTVRRVKYIYEKILDHRISRQSPLYNVANELGNVFAGSRWGRQFTYDVYQYFAIYQEGRERLNKISKNVARNRKAVIRYNKISESLKLYKNGVLRKIMFAIGNFHRSVLEMQTFFLGIRRSFKKTWRKHTIILFRLFNWLRRLFETLGFGLDYWIIANLDNTDVNMSIPSNSQLINVTDSDSAMINDVFYNRNNQMRHFEIYEKKNEIRKEADEAFERLMLSMNRISEMRSGDDKSTLACLANNLLLVAMFMETVSLVSVLFCLGEHKNKSNSEESKEEWISPERDRRSLFSTDFVEIDAIEEDSSTILKTSEQTIDIYNSVEIKKKMFATSNKENINSIKNISIGSINNFYSSTEPILEINV